MIAIAEDTTLIAEEGFFYTQIELKPDETRFYTPIITLPTKEDMKNWRLATKEEKEEWEKEHEEKEEDEELIEG